MSFCTKVSNYCRNTYNAYSTQASNAYKAVEVRVFTFPCGVGRGAQNLKAALVAMPIFLKQMVRAGKGRPALVGALQGSNIGVGVATSSSKITDLIPLASATLAATCVVQEGHVPLRKIAIPMGVGISGLMWSIGSQIYFGGLISGATPYAYGTLAGLVTAFSLDERNEENPYFYRIAGLTAGVCSAYLGSTPMGSGIISGLLVAAKTSRGNENRDFVLLVKTSLTTGSAVAGFATAGPLGAAGVSAVAGACLNSLNEMYTHSEVYFTPVRTRFHEERNEIRRSGQETLLRQHRLPISVARIITEYTE